MHLTRGWARAKCLTETRCPFLSPGNKKMTHLRLAAIARSRSGQVWRSGRGLLCGANGKGRLVE